MPSFCASERRKRLHLPGCLKPLQKTDDAASYVQRFAEIITACNLNSLTILIMEVPCCASMVGIIKQAMEQAGKSVPVEQITLSTRGEIISRSQW
jgi:hypothetical protein